VSAVGIALIIVFLVFTALMYLKRVSAMLALPIMALLLAMVANVPRQYILQEILENCTKDVIHPMMAALFGGMLALFIKNQGIAAVFVRYAAELGGDRPLVVAVCIMFATAVLFTTLGGLGAVIIVGSIILPIIMSLGVAPLTAAGIMLIGIAMGGALNIGNWQLYISVLGLPKATVRNFALIMTALYAAVGLIFCAWSLRRSRLRRFWPAPHEPAPAEEREPMRRSALLTPLVPLLLVLILDWPIVPAFIGGLIFALMAANAEGEIALVSLLILFANIWFFSKVAPQHLQTHTGGEASILRAIVGGLAAIAIFLLWEGYALVEAFRQQRSRRWKLALLTPFAALFLSHVLDWPALSGFFAGALLALVITVRRHNVQTFTKSVLESFESVAPAVILIVGIGMLLNSVKHPHVSEALRPFLLALSPRQNGFLYVVIFSLLAPLALYRGPLNIWGMGSGVAAVLLATGALEPKAIMAMLMSVGALQGVCDPTNTANVWIANFVKVDAADILRATIVYVWPLAVVALSIAAAMYF
jgi:H+/gluconate symporter-like permease